MMTCVRGVTYKFKINGIPSKVLKPGRGLRQGDPLSPYLFILAMDVFSQLLKKAEADNLISGITISRGAPPISHLLFADDVIIFAKAEMGEVCELMKILNLFTGATGQKVNVLKSGLIFGKKVLPYMKNQISQVMNMQAWNDPGRYLGLPAQWGRSKIAALTWIKESIMAKMEGWKEKLLNPAGKEVLIKAVIQAIPTYAMSILKFPKKFCDSICARIAKFWWANSGKERGVHWRNWQLLTRSKRNGGLGFKEFSYMNLALLAKQAWRIVNQPNSLWVRFLKAIYFPNHSFFEARKKKGMSWIWASILQGRDFLQSHGRWIIGDGKSVRIWQDKWLPDNILLPAPINDDDSRVSTLIDSSGKKWDVTMLRQKLPPQAAIQTIQLPISIMGAPDRFIWPHNTDGSYSVKTGYHIANESNQYNADRPSTSTILPSSFWNRLWNIKIANKIKIFLWRMCNNALPVR